MKNENLFCAGLESHFFRNESNHIFLIQELEKADKNKRNARENNQIFFETKKQSLKCFLKRKKRINKILHETIGTGECLLVSKNKLIINN